MIFEKIYPKYDNALRDESRCVGTAEAICFPETAEEAAEAVQEAVKQGLKIKIQGACTGLTGSAVPDGGLVLRGEKLKNIDFNPDGSLHVGAGATLEAIDAFLHKSGKVFLPKPTEKTATIGGMFGVNAMGLDGQRMSDYIEGLQFLLSNGKIVEICRGEGIFDDTGCNLPWGGRLVCEGFEDIGVLNGFVPLRDKDMINLLCGTEGTLGMALSFNLRLSVKKAYRWGVVYFMDSEASAVRFMEQIPKNKALKTLEYFDPETLKLLSDSRDAVQVLKALPMFPAGSKAAVYVELADDDSEVIEAVLFDQMDAFEAFGGSEEMTWAADEELEIERFRNLRHTIIEIVNVRIDSLRQNMPGLTRISADFAGAPEEVKSYLKRYREDTKDCGCEVLIYGAFDKNRLHVSFLPKTLEAVNTAKQIIFEWAKMVAEDKGQIVTENGMGRLKKELATSFLDVGRAKAIEYIKKAIDPEGVFV